MNVYKNAVVYKIVNNRDDKIYVGSTCMSLYDRMYKHLSDSKRREKMRNVYDHLNSIGWDNVWGEILEHYPCNSREDLRIRERYWFDELHPELNTRKPFTTKKEKQENMNKLKREFWYKHRDVLLEKKRIYAQANREHINQKKKEVMLCSACNCNICINHKTRHERTLKHIKNFILS